MPWVSCCKSESSDVQSFWTRTYQEIQKQNPYILIFLEGFAYTWGFEFFFFFFFFWDEGFDSILMELKKTPSNYHCGQVKPWITPWTQFNSISIKRSETHVLQPQNTKKKTSDSIMRKLN